MTLFNWPIQAGQLQPVPPEAPSPPVIGQNTLDQTVIKAAQADAARAASLAALGNRAQTDGAQFADGSRWLWQVSGTVDGYSCVAATGGVWVRDTPQQQHPNRAGLLASISPAATHLLGPDVFDLLAAGDTSTIDGGVVLLRADGRKLRRRYNGSPQAAWWGFGDIWDNGLVNKTALVAALAYCTAARQYELLLPHNANKPFAVLYSASGITVAPGISLNQNIKLRSLGVTIINCTSNAPVFIIASAKDMGDPMEDWYHFEIANRAGIEGVIFRGQNPDGSISTPIGQAVKFGNDNSKDGDDVSAGSGYVMRGCGFYQLDKGFLWGNHVWTVTFENCSFSYNTNHGYLYGNRLTGENVVFDRCTINGSTFVGFLIETTAKDCPYTLFFNHCSLDYNKTLFYIGGTETTINLQNCYWEYDGADDQVKCGVTTGHSAVVVKGGIMWGASNVAGRFFDSSCDVLSVVVDGVRVTHTKQFPGITLTPGRVVTVPEGAKSVEFWVGYTNPQSFPRVQQLGAAPLKFAIQQYFADNHKCTITLDQAAPSGGAKFYVNG